MYKPTTTQDATGEVYALIVRVDRDGSENVIHGYKGRYFKTMKAAIKSTTGYIAKHALNA